MASKGKKTAVAKKKANGYKMPAPIPLGEVIHDTVANKKWRIGPSIGVGGFGEIYSACNHESSPKKGLNYPFVVKIEPIENGPLFVEKHFYIKNGKKEDIENFRKSKKLTNFGMPLYFGHGSHDFKGEKYRYLVLERYGKDIWSLFIDNGRSFPPATAFQLGLQMLDVLEYIHSKGYVHADLKGANILIGLKKGTENQAYLVDFGLATRITEKEFKPDPRCAHNGTIEYTSRDAHLGVPTMRGDLEILGYNMLQWLVGELPWENSLKQPKTVQQMKETFMKNVRKNITEQYNDVPDALVKFFEYINTLAPKDVPNYAKCRQLFESYLKTVGKSKSSTLDLTSSKREQEKVTKTGKKLVVNNQDNNEKENEKATKTNGESQKPIKRQEKGRKAKNEEVQDINNIKENEKATKTNGESQKPIKRQNKGRKAKNEEVQDIVEPAESENGNGENGCAIKKKRVTKTNLKRKSAEPALLLKVKKAKMAPKATPPAKKNHANISTQTSIEKQKRSPRQVTFHSPVSEVLGSKRSTLSSANSSGDIFEDSFVIEEKKVKKKRGLLSVEEVTVMEVVTKKVTEVVPKGKS